MCPSPLSFYTPTIVCSCSHSLSRSLPSTLTCGIRALALREILSHPRILSASRLPLSLADTFLAWISSIRGSFSLRASSASDSPVFCVFCAISAFSSRHFASPTFYHFPATKRTSVHPPDTVPKISPRFPPQISPRFPPRFPAFCRLLILPWCLDSCLPLISHSVEFFSQPRAARTLSRSARTVLVLFWASFLACELPLGVLGVGQLYFGLSSPFPAVPCSWEGPSASFSADILFSTVLTLSLFYSRYFFLRLPL